MFMIVPILKNNADSKMILNANYVVAVTAGFNGLCVLLSTGEEVCVMLNSEDFMTMLENATGKTIVSR